MATATSSGLAIHYEVFGAGPPIMLVHGWGSDLRGNWLATGWVEALAATHRVVALDVRGHGRSAKPSTGAAYGYAEMAGDVLAVMDALAIERAALLGYSMGAFMGAWLLGHRPERFERMILGGIGDETEASVAAVESIAAGLRAADPAALDDPVALAYRRFVDADPAIDADAREALAVSALRMWPEGDAVAVGGPGLAAGGVPVLVVVGDRDRPYVDTVHRFVAATADCELRVLAGCDHLGAVTAPAFRAAALEFLAGTGRDDGYAGARGEADGGR